MRHVISCAKRGQLLHFNGDRRHTCKGSPCSFFLFRPSPILFTTLTGMAETQREESKKNGVKFNLPNPHTPNPLGTSQISTLDLVTHLLLTKIANVTAMQFHPSQWPHFNQDPSAWSMVFASSLAASFLRYKGTFWTANRTCGHGRHVPHMLASHEENESWLVAIADIRRAQTRRCEKLIVACCWCRRLPHISMLS